MLYSVSVKRKLYIAAAIFLPLLGLTAWIAFASDTICARVKIEIKQEVTLERQAFDAHMKINNGLSGISLENVSINVTFTDAKGNAVLASSDPDNKDSLFFIKVDSMDNISNVDGTGKVAPSSSADIHWMIIPAQGASNGLESGTLYNVGATLKYTIGGEEKTTVVSPDYIFVKPMPNLVLDYFLPSDVYGDDPMTDEIENIIPFSLGVRVTNTGHGTAKNLKIDSAQPKIVENEQGLLINFILEGSQVENQDEKDTLLVNIGDIPPSTSKMARWKMSCSLSGKFVEFYATYSHSDELGGELTSLISQVNTHVLVEEVLVDLPGRDKVWDYLAKDGDVYRVYESNNTATDVTNQSTYASLQQNGQNGSETSYSMNTPQTAGFMYVQLPDPNNGSKIIKQVVRSDGKTIRTENAWLSKTKDSNKKWKYFVNIFDVSTTGNYTFVFDSISSQPHAPNLQYIPDRTGAEKKQVSFIVEASDPNGDVPILSASPLPVGAKFIDQGNGKAIFDWTPSDGQAGRYTIVYKATDGKLESSRSAVITINALDDSDSDGMKDSWELAHFGTLDRDGKGDYDGDGISDLDEYLLGLNPNFKETVPGIPVILSPSNGHSITSLKPSLCVKNSLNPENSTIVYEYEIYSDKGFTNKVAENKAVPEGDLKTIWSVPSDLPDHTHYYWRVRAVTGVVKTLWAYGDFIVNSVQLPPSAFNISSPSNGMSVDTLTPVLQINNAKACDGESITYMFEVYSDKDLKSLVIVSGEIPQGSMGLTEWKVQVNSSSILQEGVQYYWHAIAKDSNGSSTSCPPGSFTVNLSNSAPWAPVILSPVSSSIVTAKDLDLVINNGIDRSGLSLSYFYEMDVVNTFDSPSKQVSGPNSTSWHISGLQDNTPYYWRVKASDGVSESLWSTGNYLVSLVNESPSVPVIKNPGISAWLAEGHVTLSVHPALDPERKPLSYSYELYSDEKMSTLINEAENVGEEWSLSVELKNNTRYFWRVRSVDTDGAASDWTELASFFIKKSAANDALHVNITTSNGDSITGTAVYAFTDKGVYTGLSSTTDNDGIALFDPANFNEGYYKFRVTCLGRDYWTDVIKMPGTYNVNLVIQEKDVTLTVTTESGSVSGVRVYLFSDSGSYLGVYADTDSQGRITLSLPVDSSFKFRADILGNQYWSDVCPIVSNGSNNFTVITGGGLFGITLQEKTGVPMPNIHMYLFKNTGGYLDKNGMTDISGYVSFDVTKGIYKVRADYLGYQFWGDDTLITGNTSTVMTIPHNDVAVTVNSVFKNTASSIDGIKVYLFSEPGSYMNISHTTDINGQVIFHIPEKVYKVRVDYMGSQFWSEPFSIDDVTVDIPMAEASVWFGWGDHNIQGAHVYAFSQAGSYLYINGVTGVDGKTVFRLPADRTYLFRADYQAGQFWSPAAKLIADQKNAINISADGGRLTYTVQNNSGVPIADVQSYVFNQDGTYLGEHGATDSTGSVSFDLVHGDYTIRTDYLGYQFWTSVYAVPDNLSEIFTILFSNVLVSVNGQFGDTLQPLSDVPVYVFTPGGSYVNRTGVTDNVGNAVFCLPDKPYKVRADYMGHQFWSDEFTAQNTGINIPMADAQISVSFSGSKLSAVNVYAFSSQNSYLNVSGTTDNNGVVTFRLPAGSYNFRADYQGSQFWSGTRTLEQSQVNSIDISTGGGPFVLNVMKDAANPLTGLSCYVFNESGSYLYIQGATNSNGQVTFNLVHGRYKIRVDYLGYQFWTNVYEINGPTENTFTILHQNTTLTVNKSFNGALTSLPGAAMYLFTQSGSYVNLSKTTDANGQAAFNLPAQSYKVRVDYLGGQFWSDAFTQQDTVVNIPMADAIISVTGAGQALNGVPAYIFNSSGSYLSVTGTTAVNGTVTFRLPSGSYKFRADYQSKQFWSDVVQLTVNQQIPVLINTGGGQFTLTVKKSDTGDLTGVRCYAFNTAGAYLGLSSTTDTSGKAIFPLADGSYKFRADYLGYQFWTGVETVPGTLSDTLTITHHDSVLTVDGVDQGSKPITGAKVYLFTDSGSYMNISSTTDTNGQTIFSIPEMNYKARIDYLGYQFWSDLLSMTGTTVNINQGTAAVHVRKDGQGVSGAMVYLFTSSGQYMSCSATTGTSGDVQFEIPDRAYKFRVDKSGVQTWTSPVTVQPGGVTDITVTL